VSLKLVPDEATVERLAPESWDVRITTSCDALRGVIAGAVNVSSLVASGRLRSELSAPEAQELDVIATAHHFWKAVSDPDYVRVATTNQSGPKKDPVVTGFHSDDRAVDRLLRVVARPVAPVGRLVGAKARAEKGPVDLPSICRAPMATVHPCPSR
jgi:hypothetical protein